MKTKNKNVEFKRGDWVSTTQLHLPGQKYTMAKVRKVLKKGSWLLVEFGDYFNETIVEANKCKLVKRG